MSRQIVISKALVVALVSLSIFGCAPKRLLMPPRGKYVSDLNYYLDTASNVSHSDLTTHPPQSAFSATPISQRDPNTVEKLDLTLDQAIAIALQNSEVIRNSASVTIPTTPLPRPETIASLYDPAIIANDSQLGVYSALAEFDTQLSTSIFWEKRERPQNFGFFLPILESASAQFIMTASKKSVLGTQLFFRNVTDYERTNNPFQAVPSAYITAMEIEARQPMLRGAGARINRVPVTLARINTDVSLLELEAQVRDLALQVENAYWDLYCSYRNVKAARTGYERSESTWKVIERQAEVGRERQENELLTREQKLGFLVALQRSIAELYDRENNLRFLLGLPATDGRILSPIDEPVEAKVDFQWEDIQAESFVRTLELRRQKALIKQRELQLIVAKNQLLPELNAVGLYRWLGVGDELAGAGGSGVRFPAAGSRAFEELAIGDYQEARFGMELVMPIYRRELAQVRDNQLLLVREKARLQNLELAASHQLTNAVRDMVSNHEFAQVYKQRMEAAEEEREKRDLASDLPGGMSLARLQALLDSQRRSAVSQADYYRALCDFNKSIVLVHYRKGSLLEYCGVRLAEGCKPYSMYLDAIGSARRQNGAEFLDYRLDGSHDQSVKEPSTDVHEELTTPVPDLGDVLNAPVVESAEPMDLERLPPLRSP